MSKNMKNTRKITVRTITVTPDEMKVQNKHNLIQHAAQEKVAMSTHSMNDVIAFYVFNTCLESSASITQKGNVFCTKLK